MPSKKKTCKEVNDNINTHYTKQKLLQRLVKKTGLTKNNINSIFLELENIIEDHMKKDGPEKFILPGILKITVKTIAEKKEKIGLNPFTKKEMLFKAKPESKKIKIKALKKLKDMVN